jgi:Dolichyl-phosphate-mannose-protein mannosyltransferase
MNNPIFRKFFANANLIFLFLAIFLVLLVRLRLLNIPFERDEGEYAYAGQSLLQGLLPYRDFYNMKMPGTYFAFALIIKYLGNSAIAIRMVVMVLNFINAGLVYAIAKTRLNTDESRIATSVYLLLSLTYEAQGWVSNSEHFVLLPALLGIYALSLFENTHDLKQYLLLFLSGIALTAALLTKQHAFGYGLFGGFWIGFRSWENIKQSNLGSFDGLKMIIIRYLFFGIGCLLPILALGAYLYKNNLFESFYFLTFKYAAAYTSLITPPLKYISNFRPIFWNSCVHWVLFFAVIRVLCLSKRSEKIAETPLEVRSLRVYLLLFFVCSFACVCPGYYFRPHYFQLMFPVSALIIALGLSKQRILWAKTTQKGHLTTLKLQGFAWIAFIIAQFGYLFTWTPEKIILNMYEAASFTQMREVGETLSKYTQPTDKIGMLSAEPEIFFYANRTAATGFLYHYPLIEHQKYADTMSKQFVREVEAARPKIFIYSFVMKDETHNPLTANYLNHWKESFCNDYEIIGKVYKDLSKPRLAAYSRWKHLNQDLSNDSSVTVIMEIFNRKTTSPN